MNEHEYVEHKPYTGPGCAICGRPRYVHDMARELRELRKDRERLAAWMIKRGFVTGHGDSFEALLCELDWQYLEVRNAALRELVENTPA